MIEIDCLLAQALEQYCTAKKWSENYFVINAIEKELIEESVFIHHNRTFLDENEKPIDFTLFLNSINEYIKNDKNNPQVKKVNEIMPDFKN